MLLFRFSFLDFLFSIISWLFGLLHCLDFLLRFMLFFNLGFNFYLFLDHLFLLFVLSSL
jgi:hypothetical protein